MARVDITKRLDPQMAAALAKQQELAPGLGKMSELSLERVRELYIQERRYWNAEGPPLPEVRDGAVAGPHGDIPLRFYYPLEARPLPAVVYLHGGGWIVGNLDTHDRIMRLLAQGSGAAVVGVDYRLAPEHKFPTALEEVLAVVRTLGAEGDALGLDTARLAVAGDSAGANMSAAACLEMGKGLLKAAVLIYGGYGLRDSGSRRKYGGEEDGMGPEDLAYYAAQLIRTEADLKDPRYNVLSADLAGLPPAFIAAAELDPLHDDSVVLADLLADAGVEHRLEVYRGMLHGFLHLSRMVDAAQTALDDAAAWLKTVLASKQNV